MDRKTCVRQSEASSSYQVTSWNFRGALFFHPEQVWGSRELRRQWSLTCFLLKQRTTPFYSDYISVAGRAGQPGDPTSSLVFTSQQTTFSTTDSAPHLTSSLVLSATRERRQGIPHPLATRSSYCLRHTGEHPLSLLTQDLNEPSFAHVARLVPRTGDSPAAPTSPHLLSIPSESFGSFDRNIKCTFDGGGGVTQGREEARGHATLLCPSEFVGD